MRGAARFGSRGLEASPGLNGVRVPSRVAVILVAKTRLAVFDYLSAVCDADPFMLQMYVARAEKERRLLSERRSRVGSRRGQLEHAFGTRVILCHCRLYHPGRASSRGAAQAMETMMTVNEPLDDNARRGSVKEPTHTSKWRGRHFDQERQKVRFRTMQRWCTTNDHDTECTTWIRSKEKIFLSLAQPDF